MAGFSGDPFTLGVASGDPNDNSAILWTRLVPTEAANRLGADDQAVLWEVSADDSFSPLVRAGVATAPAALGHSVHVNVDGLAPDSWYFYRFRVGDFTSPVGRTRTFPDPASSPGALRFGVSSCQHYQHGYYAAHRHLANAGLDLFVWLGDYIYERGPKRTVFDETRLHDSPEATTLAGYRQRYEQYKRDPDLQHHHASHPWIITWDDHEVDNNYAADLPAEDTPGLDFLDRRAAAYQAWYEHMPVRLDPPDGPSLQIYRDLQWGDLAHWFMLDTRQYRDPAPTDGRFIALGGLTDTTLPLRTLSPDALSADRTLLGTQQNGWLLQNMVATPAKWKVIGSSVVMQRFSTLPGQDPPLLIVDGWDGYSGYRRQLLERLRQDGVENIVSIAGDLHMSIAGNVRTDPFDPSSPVAMAEFVAASISSNLARITTQAWPTALEANPDMRFLDTRRGYLVCDVTPDEWVTTFVAIDNGEDPESGASPAGQYRVIAGQPGLEPA